jgi:hypothetical protein
MSYYDKYIKYKMKYIRLKQRGGEDFKPIRVKIPTIEYNHPSDNKTCQYEIAILNEYKTLEGQTVDGESIVIKTTNDDNGRDTKYYHAITIKFTHNNIQYNAKYNATTQKNDEYKNYYNDTIVLATLGQFIPSFIEENITKKKKNSN